MYISQIKLLRNSAIKLICRLENGQMWSETFRVLMDRHYNVKIGRYSYGGSLWPGKLPKGTKIGNFCSLAPGIKFFRRNHPWSFISQHPFFFNNRLGLIERDSIEAIEDNPLLIMNDVWIGSNAIITPQCRRIGNGVVVGAGAVVTTDVPDFAIVAGNPARMIRKRFSEDMCEEILRSRWWEYKIDNLMPALQIFLEDATLENAQQLKEYLRSLPDVKNPDMY